ncbi:hypothetical protein [Nitrospirillum sp. BR 11163]|uniref:hypothetical protein n=1 Tax=Nitrospirillum sp. BR 11163 TaxID=3104323 RepID=UPI002AFE62A8|nr:hypothetical protein [Nitrospirillum sp. BR 11163]MEA1672894.1 hypothetical protein [Nitrospirillum sp. BR 11163]
MIEDDEICLRRLSGLSPQDIANFRDRMLAADYAPGDGRAPHEPHRHRHRVNRRQKGAPGLLALNSLTNQQKLY